MLNCLVGLSRKEVWLVGSGFRDENWANDGFRMILDRLISFFHIDEREQAGFLVEKSVYKIHFLKNSCDFARTFFLSDVYGFQGKIFTISHFRDLFRIISNLYANSRFEPGLKPVFVKGFFESARDWAVTIHKKAKGWLFFSTYKKVHPYIWNNQTQKTRTVAMNTNLGSQNTKNSIKKGNGEKSQESFYKHLNCKILFSKSTQPDK